MNYYTPYGYANRDKDYVVLTHATAAPITVDDLKTHLFIFDNDNDVYLEEILLSAQQMVCQYLGEFTVDTTCRADRCEFTTTILPQRHVSSVSSIQYYDTDNELQTLPASAYIIENSSNGVRIKYTSNTLPTLSNDYARPVIITYVAVLNPIPDTVRQAIRITAAEMFQSRTFTTDRNVQQLPLTVVQTITISTEVLMAAVGNFRHRVQFQTREDGLDLFGQPSEVYTTVYTAGAHASQLSGNERERFTQGVATEDDFVSITVRYSQTLDGLPNDARALIQWWVL